MSPPSRGAWIEIYKELGETFKKVKSPPSRGAWIEILMNFYSHVSGYVAPLAGGVD